MVAYFVQNGGDGSVSARFYSTFKEAEFAEELEGILYDEGWGEPSVGEVPTKFDSFLDEAKEELDNEWISDEAKIQIRELIKKYNEGE